MKIKKNNYYAFIELLLLLSTLYTNTMEQIPFATKSPVPQHAPTQNIIDTTKNELLLLIKVKKKLLMKKHHEENDNGFFTAKIIISLDILKNKVKDDLLSHTVLENEKNLIKKSLILLKETDENHSQTNHNKKPY